MANRNGTPNDSSHFSDLMVPGLYSLNFVTKIRIVHLYELCLVYMYKKYSAKC